MLPEDNQESTILSQNVNNEKRTSALSNKAQSSRAESIDHELNCEWS